MSAILIFTKNHIKKSKQMQFPETCSQQVFQRILFIIYGKNQAISGGVSEVCENAYFRMITVITKSCCPF